MNELQRLLNLLAAGDLAIDAHDSAIAGLLGNDTLTDDQQAEHDTHVAGRAELVIAREATEASIATERERLARDDQRATLAAEIAQRGEPAPRRSGSDGIVAPGSVSSIPATARRIGRLENFHGIKGGVDPQERAYRFGMYSLSVLGRDIPRFANDGVSQFCRDNGLQGAAHQSNDGSGTQYLIPEEFGNDLVDLREQYGVARQVLKVVPMSSDTRTDPRRATGLTAYFVGEGDAITESNKTLDQIRLVARKLAAIARISNEVNADAAINFGDDLIGEIAYAFAAKEDDCAFNGDGTSTYGGIIGVRPKLQDHDGTGTDSIGAVAQGTGTTWGAQVLADFEGLVGVLPQYADTPNAAWLCHKTYYHSVMASLLHASGGTPGSEIASGDRSPRPLFLGYPVMFSQQYPSATATTQLSVTLGDHSMAARFGDRQQESFAFSDSAYVNSESVFERDQIAVRGTERFDINVHDVGDASNYGPVVGLKTG